jgi:hypothetical protein
MGKVLLSDEVRARIGELWAQGGPSVDVREG